MCRLNMIFPPCDKKKSPEQLFVAPSHLPSSSSDESDETTRYSITYKRAILLFKPNKYNMMDISSSFQMYRLDISNIFSLNPFVTWLPTKCISVFSSPSCSSLSCSLICA
ncbi:unnamed protein product [Rotaria sp. Silwood2]|nr:unnamed protein product [Rotaria sp. Silwood2]CAF3003267.1 unnamed protein product [Rotaria sp. Silwood2]CAF3335039.1 unnamed protein product [Rotaria sp. Silwood2]CAF3448907.1 unnamed protein product [Rotaria sp. Silwood2]CAF4388140.1 unnamed protein product [Rotaria sp. Silwood2]